LKNNTHGEISLRDQPKVSTMLFGALDFSGAVDFLLLRLSANNR
jgi:hypothetical protein